MNDEGGVRWRNRIVGQGVEHPDQLLANPQNWRVHPSRQQAALNDLIGRVGWVQQIIVNQRTGHVVDGHLRVVLASRRDEPEVPVLYVDLSEEEERLVLATLDPVAEMAVPDREQLAVLLTDLRAETLPVSLSSLLADLAGTEEAAPGAPAQARSNQRTCPNCGFRWSGK